MFGYLPVPLRKSQWMEDNVVQLNVRKAYKKFGGNNLKAIFSAAFERKGQVGTCLRVCRKVGSQHPIFCAKRRLDVTKAFDKL